MWTAVALVLGAGAVVVLGVLADYVIGVAVRSAQSESFDEWSDRQW